MQTIVKLVLVILLLVFLGVGGTMIYVFVTRNEDGETSLSETGSPAATTEAPPAAPSPNGSGSPTDRTAPPVDSSTCSEYATEECEFVRALLAERVGFGRHTVGGLGGRIYHVTTLVDEGPGSLRYGLDQTEPLWIVFDVEGTIDVKTRMTCRSRKTVDGRGARVVIEGHGFYVRHEHTILTDLEFRNTEDDAVSARGGQHAWIHRCKMGDTRAMHKDVADGLIDITHGFTDCTVSWCYFYKHDKGFLVVNVTNVTYHHNFFFDINSRIPALGSHDNYPYVWGSDPVRFHSFNNLRKKCKGLRGAAVDVRPLNTTVLLENDLFLDSGSVGSNWSEDDRTHGYAWVIQGCIRRGGTALPNDKDPHTVFEPDYPYELENANDLEYLEHQTGPRRDVR